MYAILPLALLVIAVVLVAIMPWHRPHPNHLFFLELLKNHLQDRPEFKGDPSEKRSWVQNRCVRLLNENASHEH